MLYDAAELKNVRAEIPAGYFLPSEAEAVFRAHAEKMNVFRRIATVVFTENGENKIETVPPFGEAVFVGENGAIPESDVHIMPYTVKPHTIKKISKISKELAADAGFDLPSAIARDFGREFGKGEEDGCINGNGYDRPVGVLHADEGAETGVTVQGTASLGFDDVLALLFSLDAEYHRNAIWLMNDQTALHLRTLKGSCGMHLWRESDDTVLGRPRVYIAVYAHYSRREQACPVR